MLEHRKRRLKMELGPEVTVRVVNPASRREVNLRRIPVQLLDVLTKVGTNRNGDAVLTVGCRINDEWLPIKFLDPKEHCWWERLCYVPPRWICRPQQPARLRKCPEMASRMLDYDRRLRDCAPKRRLKWREPELQVTGPKMGTKRCAESGDRLGVLPLRKRLRKRQICGEYVEMFKRMQKAEEEERQRRLRRKMAALERRKEMESSVHEFEEKVHSLIDELISLSGDSENIEKEGQVMEQDVPLEEILDAVENGEQKSQERDVIEVEIEHQEGDPGGAIVTEENVAVEDKSVDEEMARAEDVEENLDADGNVSGENDMLLDAADQESSSTSTNVNTVELGQEEGEETGCSQDVEILDDLEQLEESVSANNNVEIFDSQSTQSADQESGTAVDKSADQDDWKTAEDIVEPIATADDTLDTIVVEENEGQATVGDESRMLTSLTENEPEDTQTSHDVTDGSLLQSLDDQQQEISIDISELLTDEHVADINKSVLKLGSGKSSNRPGFKIFNSPRRNWLVREDDGRPWWDRLSKPVERKPRVSVPLVKKFKAKQIIWKKNFKIEAKISSRRTDNDWVTRLSRPKKAPYIRRPYEPPKPTMFKMSKRTRALANKRKDSKEWWNRLSKPKK